MIIDDGAIEAKRMVLKHINDEVKDIQLFKILIEYFNVLGESRAALTGAYNTDQNYFSLQRFT